MTRIPHSLDKALTNQGMMFDEFDSLSLSLSLSLGGTGSIRAVGFSHQGPDHRRDETKQDTNVSNGAILFSYIFIPLKDMGGCGD